MATGPFQSDPRNDPGDIDARIGLRSARNGTKVSGEGKKIFEKSILHPPSCYGTCGGQVREAHSYSPAFTPVKRFTGVNAGLYEKQDGE